ncbi:MAG: Cas9 inhibitor AcrIIA9 family protein [Parachlamydiales bacterium]
MEAKLGELRKPLQMQVVVNHKVELTEEEIREAKTKAINDLIESEKARMLKKNIPKTAVTPKVMVEKTENNELSLF